MLSRHFHASKDEHGSDVNGFRDLIFEMSVTSQEREFPGQMHYSSKESEIGKKISVFKEFGLKEQISITHNPLNPILIEKLYVVKKIKTGYEKIWN